MGKPHRRHFLASSAGLAAFAAIKANSHPSVAPRLKAIAGHTYALKDEKTYCAKGCEIGHFGNDVQYGAEPKMGDLVPVDGMSIGMEKCPFCAAPVCHDCGQYFFAI